MANHQHKTKPSGEGAALPEIAEQSHIRFHHVIPPLCLVCCSPIRERLNTALRSAAVPRSLGMCPRSRLQGAPVKGEPPAQDRTKWRRGACAQNSSWLLGGALGTLNGADTLSGFGGSSKVPHDTSIACTGSTPLGPRSKPSFTPFLHTVCNDVLA
jgi:hypothetical protein